MDSSGQEAVPFNWEDSLKTAIQIGISYSDYQEMSPYELAVAVEAFTEMAEIEAQERLTYVWLGEYYHRQKILPSLEKVLKPTKSTQPKQMTDDEMLSVVKRLNAQFGGIVKKGEINESERKESTSDSLQSGNDSIPSG
jgi:hypothetical protein